MDGLSISIIGVRPFVYNVPIDVPHKTYSVTDYITDTDIKQYSG